MELKILGKDGSEKGKIKMPALFSVQLRKDLIKRAVNTIESNMRQPYGAKTEAGLRASAKLSRKRNDYRGSYGHGISRVPRKIMSSRGTRFNWVAAVMPGVVGGRRAHPPKASKIYDKKINAKENRLAICSGMAAAMKKDVVQERGHKVPGNYPFVVDDTVESIQKSKDLKETLLKLGFKDELTRTAAKSTRAGKGKLRGRRHITKKGLLFVLGKKSNIQKACSNIPGCESVNIENVNVKLLAPGGVPGRMTLFSRSAIEKLSTDKLFTEERVKKAVDKVKKTKRTKKTKNSKKTKKIESKEGKNSKEEKFA